MPRTRWSRRHKQTFGLKEQEDENVNHRLPPKPRHYYTKTKGHCRLCGLFILKEDDNINMRKSWHKDCVDEYMFIYHSAETRKVVFERDMGVCNWCGDKARGWHADHIKPLVEQKDKEVLDYSYWSLDNLQTLCPNCHYKKTGEEATKRATKRNRTNYKSFREVFEI